MTPESMQPGHAIQRTIRIGTPADQDAWRRDDYRRLTPEQRLALAVRLREQAWPNALPIRSVFSIRRVSMP
jgi:hypothetical protein